MHYAEEGWEDNGKECQEGRKRGREYLARLKSQRRLDAFIVVHRVDLVVLLGSALALVVHNSELGGGDQAILVGISEDEIGLGGAVDEGVDLSNEQGAFLLAIGGAQDDGLAYDGLAYGGESRESNGWGEEMHSVK